MGRTTYYIDSNQLPNKRFSWTKAYRYAKLMEEGVEFPPVNVFKNTYKNGRLDFNDGRHRVAASKLTGIKLKVRSSHGI